MLDVPNMQQRMVSIERQFKLWPPSKWLIRLQSPSVFNEMLAKHPKTDPSLFPPFPPPPPPATLPSIEVSQAPRSFPNGSSPGPISYAPAIWKKLFCVLPLKELTQLYMLLQRQSICAPLVRFHLHEVVSHLCGATLLPVKRNRVASVPLKFSVD